MKNLILSAVAVLPFAMMISCSPKENSSKIPDATPAPATNTVSLTNETTPTLAALQKNPDVLWMGETMVDYALNYNKYLASQKDKETMNMIGFKGVNRYKVLKQLALDLDNKDVHDMHKLVYKILFSKEMTAYKDANLAQEYTTEERTKLISSVDTIDGFDPETFKPIKQIVVNELNPDDVVVLRVKQLIYYDQKEMMFRAIPLAVAPMLNQYDDQGAYKTLAPVFWAKVNFLSQTPDLNATNIDWAKRTYRNIPIENIKVLKEMLPYVEVVDTMMSSFRANAGKIHLAHTFDADGVAVLLKLEEVSTIGASVDTIITFDPNTFKEVVQVATNKMDGNTIKQIRLLQDWIWDADNKQLGIAYQGFAPIIDRVDDQGKFINSGPVLIRRVGRDK